MNDEPDFICAICKREIEMRWNRKTGRDRVIPPVCGACESAYTKAQHWGGNGVRAPQAGAFMDRRKAIQIFVLAEALHTEAAHRKWNSRHAAA